MDKPQGDRSWLAWILFVLSVCVAVGCTWAALWHGWLSASPPAVTRAAADQHRVWFYVSVALAIISPIFGALVFRKLHAS